MNNMRHKYFESVHEFFTYGALQLQQKFAHCVAPRGLHTKELLFQQYIFKDIRCCEYDFTEEELERMQTVLRQLFLKEKVKDDFYRHGKLDDMTIGYVGIDFSEQLQNAVMTLKRDISSRQSVITFYNKGDYSWIPCTTQIQFMVRENLLHCMVSMRSIDFLNKAKFDLYLFMILQQLVANELCLGFGDFYINCNSIHYYKKDGEELSKILEHNIPYIQGKQFPKMINDARNVRAVINEAVKQYGKEFVDIWV